MKNDMNNLKKLVHEIIQKDTSSDSMQEQSENLIRNIDNNFSPQANSNFSSKKKYNKESNSEIEDTEEFIEESLSLEDKEKELIQKALEKHNGKRKYAAQELGISERTLYRNKYLLLLNVKRKISMQNLKCHFTNKLIIFIALLLTTINYACTVSYSTTGASISPDVKTVSVNFFPNRAALGTANLGQYFTDELKDKFLGQTSLTLVENYGHLNFEGEITNYNTKPIAITGDEIAAQNRLTIKVHVVFVNNNDPEQNFDTSFSRYQDYNSTENLSSVEEGLVEGIVAELVEDIFNKSVVNW
jgi:hypothetical protein